MSDITNISERASYVKGEKETSIVIIASPDNVKSRNILMLLVLWLIGGGIIVYGYFGLTDEKARIMTLVWIAFWAYFAYIMGKAFLWHWRGREIIKIRNGEMFYKRDVNGRGWVQSYDLDKIRELGRQKDAAPSWVKRLGGDYWNTDCDSVTFRYEDKEIAFGYRFSEREAEKIIGLLRVAKK